MWLESGSSGECADNTLGAGLRQLCDTWEYYAIHVIVNCYVVIKMRWERG